MITTSLRRLALASVFGLSAAGTAAAAPTILQQPALSRDQIAFVYGGDLWTVPRAGGRAFRLTTGVGVEQAPLFSPDGRTIAFTGDYDGNVDVYTVPAAGGVPTRVTHHPGNDAAVAWSRDGRRLLFRSNRTAANRYTQIFSVAATGGPAEALPLPYAHTGQLSPDGGTIAYSPFAPASGFEFDSFVSWGNYRGGRASTIWLTSLQGLDSVQIPQGDGAADYAPVFLGGKVYFLSNRTGASSIFSYDPATRQVAEVLRNADTDIRSLSTDGELLIFDRLGELFTLQPGGRPQPVRVDVAGDMPDVRPRILNVADQLRTVTVSPTGMRVAVEARGEILTAPAKKGTIRNLTNTPGVMERSPAWSPDGQSVAYFSDESGAYALHLASQTGERPVRKFSLGAEPAFYFDPVWSPDSKKIAFYDNRLRTYVLDTASGRVSTVGEPQTYGGYVSQSRDMAWSPDSRWLVYPRNGPNRLNALYLYSLARGTSTQLTDPMGDARYPAFDRSGTHLYFLGSNNAGGRTYGLDMSSNLYTPTQTIYALTLKADTLSPVAPQSDEEKSPAEAKRAAEEASDATPAGQAGEAKAAATSSSKAAVKPAVVKPTEIDLAGAPLDAIVRRTVPLPIPARTYSQLSAGKPGVIYFLEQVGAGAGPGGPEQVLNRFTLEGERKVEKLADRVAEYELTADGEKLLIGMRPADAPAELPPGAQPRPPSYVIAASNAPPKAGEGAVSFEQLDVRIDPKAEWAQMYREVFRAQRAYFYDPGFHGANLDAEERRLKPYADAALSRSDLNYVFQEALTTISVGHLRGGGGAIPTARRVPGGLLGADYAIRDGRWCISKIYSGGSWSPDAIGPLAQPGVNARAGDCVLAIDGRQVSGAMDIQAALEGTAGRSVTLRLAPASGGAARDVTVVPIANEYRLRHLDWVDANRRKVDQMSGGKLAYVYLPDTGQGGYTAFNRYYFAQAEKQGAVIDERFNGGGQMADYIIDVLSRRLQSWWAPRYGAVDRSPAHAILGPKVMIANEVAGSGGDALPWMFKENKLGPVVGKRTWGGLVGIGQYPRLMDGGQVTAPNVGFFNPRGEWEVENYGVAPDVVVEQDPKAVAAGRDPQLEAAVALALQKLAAEPPAQPRKPAYPVYPRPQAAAR